MIAPVTAAPVTAAASPLPPAGSISPAASEILPAPQPVPLDSVSMLYAMLVSSNDTQSKSEKLTAAQQADSRKKALDDQRAALKAAMDAQNQKKGFFDSIGIGGLVGLAVKSPIFVMADMSIHMAHVTPDFIQRFEEGNADKIALATKIYAGTGAIAAAAGGASTLAAAATLGGLVLQKTEVLGHDASDYAGTAMLMLGSAGTGSLNSGAVAVTGDKKSAVSDQIRKVERETQDYTQWAAVAGMAVCAAGAIVATAGTAAAPAVAIGIALSAAGFTAQQTGCLDKVLGKKAAMWLDTGMMAAGTIITGGAAATVASSTAASAMDAAGNSVEGLADYRQGGEKVQDAVIEHATDEDDASAKEAQNRAERALTAIDDVLDAVRALKDDLSRGREAATQIIDTNGQTQLIAAGAKA